MTDDDGGTATHNDTQFHEVFKFKQFTEQNMFAWLKKAPYTSPIV